MEKCKGLGNGQKCPTASGLTEAEKSHYREHLLALRGTYLEGKYCSAKYRRIKEVRIHRLVFYPVGLSCLYCDDPIINYRGAFWYRKSTLNYACCSLDCLELVQEIGIAEDIGRWTSELCERRDFIDQQLKEKRGWTNASINREVQES